MTPRRSAILAAVIALGLASASPAYAAVLSEDEFEETSTELGVILRSLSFVLTGSVLAPPVSPIDADPSGVGLFDLRGYFAHSTPSFKLVTHMQLTTALRSHASQAGIAIGRGVAPPRWLPFTARLADEETIALTGVIDWLYVAWTRGPVTITAGRQPVTFGRASLWSPTDLIGTFALTEVDTEYKPGADALRLDWSVGESTALTVVAATGELEQDNDLDASIQGSSVLARGFRGWDSGELGALVGAIRGDLVAGVDAAFGVGTIELYGEATVTLVTDESVVSPRVESGEVAAKAIVGVTGKPMSKLTVSGELMHNGFGATDGDGYLQVALSDRVGIGEQTTLGQWSAGAVASYELHPLIQIGGAALVNVTDPSGLVSLVLRANLSDNTDAVIGGYVPLGRAPAVMPLQIRDEYGLYPRFLFAELKAVY